MAGTVRVRVHLYTDGLPVSVQGDEKLHHPGVVDLATATLRRVSRVHDAGEHVRFRQVSAPVGDALAAPVSARAEVVERRDDDGSRNGDRYVVEDLDATHAAPHKQEDDADDEACDLRFPDSFPRVPARISGPWLEQTASELGVAPIVVIGHLQFLKRLDWRTTLARNAPAVGEALETWR